MDMQRTSLKVIDPAGNTTASAHATPAARPPVEPGTLRHAELVSGEFWRHIPAYKDVSEAQFLDHNWQAKNSVTRVDKLLAAIAGLVDDGFIKDAEEGFRRAPMSVRISPYMLALIDWRDPHKDPIRTQFLPLGSRLFADHPKLDLDSLHEQADAPVPGLTHRYPMVPSAEDHWYMTELIMDRCKLHIHVAHELLYAVYGLRGGPTLQNEANHRYLESRRALLLHARERLTRKQDDE